MLRFWRSQQPRWNLATPLLSFNRHDHWTISDAIMGSVIMGATGSGKTTGPGSALAGAFLRAGFGGLVLCCKPGERQAWEGYCRRAGRSRDLVIFDASGQHRFSFLDEEVQRAGPGGGLTENVINLLSTILEIAESSGGQQGREEDSYWRRAMRQLLRNAVDLVVLATGNVTVSDLYRAIVTAPTSLELLKSEEWQRQSRCFQHLQAADARTKSSRSARDFELVADYFMLEFPALSEKTRSVIVSLFTSMADVLNRSLLHELFSTTTTVRPEDTLAGKIIVVDLPLKEFGDVGKFASVLWKYCWQRAVERRDVGQNERPVFLFVDEAQSFFTEYDQQFQTTARSSRAATVYLTQNVSNLHAAFGGTSAKALTDSVLGNLQTKYFCANGDPVTNEWAASVIGRSRQLFMSAGQSHGSLDVLQLAGLGHNESTSNCNFSEQMEFEVDPRVFTSLRGGGPANKWLIDSIVFQGGRQFAASGKTWLPVVFRQDV